MFAFRPQPAFTSAGVAAFGVAGRTQAAGAVLAQRRTGGFWFGRRSSDAVPMASAGANQPAATSTAVDWEQLDPDQRVRLLGEW